MSLSWFLMGLGRVLSWIFWAGFLSVLRLSGLSLVVGLVLYISNINDEMLNRTKSNEAYFSYKYGWSFAFAAISFLLTEVRPERGHVDLWPFSLLLISPPQKGQGLVWNMIHLFTQINDVVFHALGFTLTFFHGSATLPPQLFLSFTLVPSFLCLWMFWPSGSRRDVGVPVHEALHCWGDVPTPPGLLPASPQQLLRLLWSVPAPRRLGRPWPQSLLHLLWGFSPDELLHLPGSAQVSRVRTNVVLALLRSILDQTGFCRKISDRSAVLQPCDFFKRPDC